MILQSENGSILERTTVRPLEFESLDSPEESGQPISSIAFDSEWKEQIAMLEERLVAEAEAAQRQMAEARLAGAEEVRREAAAEVERSIGEQRAEMLMHIAQFGRERERYFSEAEHEVVSLALAVAERVLHREVSLDTMLLRAAVRVALDKLKDDSGVRLRVPEAQAPAWRELLAAEGGGQTVDVIGESQMVPGNAVLETAVGRVELGIREQLKEIERGFFDLLEKRPA